MRRSSMVRLLLTCRYVDQVTVDSVGWTGRKEARGPIVRGQARLQAKSKCQWLTSDCFVPKSGMRVAEFRILSSVVLRRPCSSLMNLRLESQDV